jgi:hypothetical protein
MSSAKLYSEIADRFAQKISAILHMNSVPVI